MSESPGVFLKALRIEQGLTEREVAEKLHLLPDSIKALETDNYESFNAEVYVKGYFRSYARLLGVAPDSVLDRYTGMNKQIDNDICGAAEATSIKSKPEKQFVSFSLETKSNLPYFGATAFLIVVALLWWQGDEPATVESNSLPQGTAVIDSNDRAVVDALVSTREETASKHETAAFASEGSNSGKQIELKSAETLPEQTERSLIANVRDLLQLSFSGDCWVEVKDSENNTLVATMKHAEDTLNLEGQGPFRVLLGYAPVVKMNYNGEQVEIQHSPRNNSAKLVVGRS